MPLTGTGNGAEYALLPTGVGRDSSQESEPDRDVEAEPLLQPEPEPQPGSGAEDGSEDDYRPALSDAGSFSSGDRDSGGFLSDDSDSEPAPRSWIGGR